MSAASTSKAKTQEKGSKPEEKKQETRPHLGVLEEDDEFEEFAAAGLQRFHTVTKGY